MVDVIRALVLRELVTRFGHNRFGAVWLIAEPVLAMLLIVVLFGFRHALMGGIDTALFVITGMAPWTYFSNTITQVSHAAEANTGLFSYRQVKPIDAMVARTLLEAALAMVLYLLLLGGLAWYGIPVSVPSAIPLIAIWTLLGTLGFGVGMAIASLQVFSPAAARAFHLGIRPLFWLSGIFYAAAAMPPDWQRFVTWNPVLHCIELNRAQQFGSAYAALGDWQTPLAWAIGSLVIGLLCYRASWRRMVAV